MGMNKTCNYIYFIAPHRKNHRPPNTGTFYVMAISSVILFIKITYEKEAIFPISDYIVMVSLEMLCTG